jgi:hypothetical protein
MINGISPTQLNSSNVSSHKSRRGIIPLLTKEYFYRHLFTQSLTMLWNFSEMKEYPMIISFIS